jgi:hypothetical protein
MMALPAWSGWPAGRAAGMSKLVEVHFLEVATRGEPAVLALRWEATGPAAGCSPALDADMSLTPAGQHSTRLSLAGAYRPPRAALSAGSGPGGRLRGGRRDGTVPAGPRRGRSRPPPVAGRRRAANRRYQGCCRAPCCTRNALARLPSGRRIRLAEIEHDVPDIPDRQVQLADGVLDLPGSRMIAQQP